MLIKSRYGWELPEAAATPEGVFLNRRKLLGGLGAIGGAALIGAPALGALETSGDPTADLYPAPRNSRFKAARPLTAEAVAARYNNFYEFGAHKEIAEAARRLKRRPWTVVLDGMVEKRQELGIDTVIRRLPLEERVYRHRCVEAWSMVVPWTGFAMKELVALARPLSGVKYVMMESFLDRRMASGQRQVWYPWPYREGLTLAEASNDLVFLVTGVYGKPAANQFGAPLRLAVPWKYGFKSVKSIVTFEFTDQRPRTYWETIAGNEYGFWANVNPNVPHPRWSQASERVLGQDQRLETQLFNGYGEFVAGLYTGLEDQKLFM